MKFTPSPTAEQELREAIAAQLLEVADDIAQGAALLAPIGDPSRGTDGNKLSYRARIEPDGQVIVGSVDEQAHIVEFGSETSIEYAPMRTAIRALGHELADLGRSGASGRKRGPSKVTRKVRKAAK